MGGDARIEGVVDGDVMTMGGDIEVFGHVHGNVATSGGDLEMHPGGQVDGRRAEHGAQSFDFHRHHDGVVSRAESFAESAFSFFARFGLLLLLALGLHTLARSRYEAMQVAMVKEPVRGRAHGGRALPRRHRRHRGAWRSPSSEFRRPSSQGLSLAIASYIGMAVAAAVVGALLPVESLRGKDALRIAAGVGTLLVISLVPVAGTVLSLVLTAAGIGALALTRLGGRPLPTVPSEGPYR